MRKISRWADLEDICGDMPELFMFDINMDIPPALIRNENLEYEKLRRFPGIEWLVHAPFPFPDPHSRDKFIAEFEPMFRIIKGGSTAVFKVSPSEHDGLRFVLDFMGALYWFCHHDTSDIGYYYSCQSEAYGGNIFLDIPFPVGKTGTGTRECETAIWTRRWNPGLERMDALFSKVLIYDTGAFKELLAKIVNEKHLDHGRELWARLSSGIENIKAGKVLVRNGDCNTPNVHLDIRESLSRNLCRHLADRLRMPAESMRDPDRAWPETGDRSYCILEKAKRWPTAFAVPFNKGRVIICPSCWDDEKIEGMLGNGVATAIGMESNGKAPLGSLLNREKAGGTQSSCSGQDTGVDTRDGEKIYTLEIIVPPDAEAGDALGFVKSLRFKFNAGGDADKEKTVELDKLLKFLVIRYHSRLGKGIMFCSDKVWGKQHIPKGKGYKQVMALNSDNDKVPIATPILSGKKKSQEPSDHLNRMVCAVLFGRQRWSADDKKIIDKVFIHDTWPEKGAKSCADDIKYSTRRLELRLIIPDAFFDGLLKYKNDIIEIRALPNNLLHDLKSTLNPPLK